MVAAPALPNDERRAQRPPRVLRPPYDEGAYPLSREYAPESSWSWGESNPRPPRSHRPRYDRSRDSGREGNRTAGSVGPKPHLSHFLERQRSLPAVSGLSHRPPLLLLPGCSDQAPRDLTVRDVPLYYLKSGGKSEVSLVGASVDAPFYESEQLGSHERLLVSTSKPVSPEVESPTHDTTGEGSSVVGSSVK